MTICCVVGIEFSGEVIYPAPILDLAKKGSHRVSMAISWVGYCIFVVHGRGYYAFHVPRFLRQHHAALFGLALGDCILQRRTGDTRGAGDITYSDTSTRGELSFPADDCSYSRKHPHVDESGTVPRCA